VLCLFLFGFAWCKKTDRTRGGGITFEIDKTYSRGPLTVHVRVDKGKITIAETLLLEFETAVGPGYDVNMPRIDPGAPGLENFGIVDWQNLGNKLDANNNVVSTYRYRLEPFLSGKFAIPAFTFEFRDVNEPNGPASPEGFAGAGKTYQLATEPIDIEVTSLLGEQRGKLVIADIEDVVDMPAGTTLWWILPAVVLIAAAGGVWLYYRRKKAKEVFRVFKAPHEIAYERLQRLIQQDLIKQGKVKEFYEAISDILRHYIEDRFEIRAPERTTEEFLIEIRDTSKLSDVHGKALAEFLTHCDLVKFAKHSPMTKQIQRTFDLAKNFIGQTKSEERKIDVTDKAEAELVAGGV
jgi:hypothetical protein